MNIIEIYNLFPAILKSKLLAGELSFPEDIRFEYEKIQAYRGIVREKEDNTPVSRNDMKSYAELNKLPRGVNIKNTIDNYNVSLFSDIKSLKECFKLPRPNKKIARGFVFQEGGPTQINKETNHIGWWLYDKDIDFKEFVIEEETI